MPNLCSCEPVVVGIDLAGSSKRPTGLCVLFGEMATTTLAYGNEEIVALTAAAVPDLVTIDAPLSLPEGRRTIHDMAGEHFRPCDRVLQERGIRFFPITLGPMRMLTERGLDLKKKLETLWGYKDCVSMRVHTSWTPPPLWLERNSSQVLLR